MRLAGHTYAFRELPLDAALRQLAELGFTDVEVWLGHATDGAAHAAAIARAERSARLRGQRRRLLPLGRRHTDACRRARAGRRRTDGRQLCSAPPRRGACSHRPGRIPGRGREPLGSAARDVHRRPRSARRRALGARLPRHRSCTDGRRAAGAGGRTARHATRACAPQGRERPNAHSAAARPQAAEEIAGPSPAVFPGDGALAVGAAAGRTSSSSATTAGSPCEHEGADPVRALSVLRQVWTSY